MIRPKPQFSQQQMVEMKVVTTMACMLLWHIPATNRSAFLQGLAEAMAVEHQHQSHLHGEGQQAPEAAGGTPGIEHLQRPHLGGDHREHIHDDGQNDCKQERIRQPPVDHANAAIGEFLKHRFTLLCCYRPGPSQSVGLISVLIL